MTDIYTKANIKARYLAGDSYTEIANNLKLGRSVVAGHIYRMRDELPPRGKLPRGRDQKPRKPRLFKPKKLQPTSIVVNQEPPRIKPYVKKRELSRRELYEELHQAVLNTR